VFRKQPAIDNRCTALSPPIMLRERADGARGSMQPTTEPVRHRTMGRVSRVLGGMAVLLLFIAVVGVQLAILHLQWQNGPSLPSSVYHSMPEGDFASLWAAGRFVRAHMPAGVYDGATFQAWRQQLFGVDLTRFDWLYAPPMIVLGIAVSYLPLLPSYLLWCGAIVVLSLWALRRAGVPWAVALLGFLGPATWHGLILGQYAPLAGAFSVAALLHARTRPLPAGIAAALAALKPQLGVLIPLAWIARRRWRAFATAVAGVALLGFVSTAMLGVAIWPAFLHGGGESGRMILAGASGSADPPNAASFFALLRALDVPIGIAYAAQAACALAAAAQAIRAGLRDEADDERLTMLTVALSLLVSPYLYASDLVGYSIAVAMLARRRPTWWFPLALLWLAPGLAGPITLVLGWPVLPLCVPIVAALIWRARLPT
jgi:hypothetical protein